MATSRGTTRGSAWTLLSLLILIIFLGYTALLCKEQPKTVFKCVALNCSASNLPAIDSHSIQDFSISFRVKSIISSSTIGGLTTGNLYIVKSEHQYTLNIPMRYGSSPYFSVILKSLIQGDQITVKIKQSQSFDVSENDHLLYTHRYETPVFYVSKPLLDTPGFKLTFSRYVFNLKSYQKSSKNVNLATIIFLIGSPLISFLLLKITSRQLENKSKTTKRILTVIGPPLMPFTALWVASIFRWTSQRLDFTGAGSPGPFGPVGPLFSDIFQVFQAGAFPKPYLGGATDYPPFAVALGRLSLLIPMTFLVFLVFVLFCFLMGLALKPFLVRATLASRLKLLVLIFFSYPILFGIARGNLDLISIALVLTSVICYSKQSKKIAILTLSIAIALKYWPVVFLLLLIKRRDLKSLVLVIFFASALTLVSTVVLGYTNLPSIIAVIFKPLLDYGVSAESLTSYTYSYSINTLVLFVAIILMSANPLNPSVMESHHASMLVHGFTHFFVLFISFCILTILYKKMTKTSSIFLLAGAASLLFTSTSAVYRAGILVVCLVVRMRENEDDVWRYRKKEKNSKSSNRLAQGLRLIEILSWLIVLTPTDFYYQKGTLFSTESILQPIAVIGLLTVEYFFSIQKADVRMRAKT